MRKFSFRRRFVLYDCAAALTLVAVLVIILVIPSVESDIDPQATPQRAVTALGIHAAMGIAIALTLLLIAAQGASESRWISHLIVGLSVPTLLLGVALTDAAFAYWSHGEAMRNTALLLFACAATQGLVAIAMLAARKPA